MLSDYQIEKTRVPIVLRTLSGEEYEGDVFLQPYTQHRRGREEVADLLNGGEPFFPLRCSSGEIRFFPKERIVEAELRDGMHEDDAGLGAREAMIEVTLADGRTFTAAITYEVPTARPRLLDFLNRLDRRFLLVRVDAVPRLINSRHIDFLRPLD